MSAIGLPVKTTLNLGCGNAPKGNSVNHDRIKHRPEVDVAHDLNVLPWPWPDNSFDTIIARSVFEHLEIDLVASLNECWRILRRGGHVFLKLPYWKSDVAYCDPTHRWVFTLGSFDQFDPDSKRGREYGFYTPRKWRICAPPALNHSESSVIVRMEVRK